MERASLRLSLAFLVLSVAACTNSSSPASDGGRTAGPDGVDATSLSNPLRDDASQPGTSAQLDLGPAAPLPDAVASSLEDTPGDTLLVPSGDAAAPIPTANFDGGPSGTSSFDTGSLETPAGIVSDDAKSVAGGDASPDALRTSDASPWGSEPPVDTGAVDTGAALPSSPDASPAPSDAGSAVEPGVVTGTLTGLPAGVMATVMLGNDGFMASQKVAGGGTFRFAQVPEGTYFLKVQAPGYDAGPAREVAVAQAALKMKMLKMKIMMGGEPVDAEAASAPLDFTLSPLPTNQFKYHWQEDVSRGGYEVSAHVVQPPQVTFLDQPVAVPELAAADTLSAQYAVVLSDEDQAWNSEFTYRLLETMRSVPQPVRKNAGEQTLKSSKWILTNRHIAGDIELTYAADGTTVTISADAFVYASPRMVMVDGQRGRFFSKRLHHALVRYATNGGSDITAVEKILTERFGCTTVVPDYTALTAPTTREDAGRFMAFHPDELLQIMDMFEEMPDGFHSIVGLKYLVRRGAGLVHPMYPSVPAVAWALPDLFPNGSYIEFMDSAFTANPDDTHRLILHEKAHFLWGYVFSKQLRDDWTTLGGWYPDSTDPDGWSTTKTTEFVSAYAHKKNPNEDMAESIAYFVLDPAALQSRAIEKYEFIRDRIMQGSRYISRIQQDLSFEVLDLYPDYEYPGKIQRLDITVDGAPEADKVATIEIELLTADRVFAGASNAYLRMFSSINTYQELYLYPVDATGAVLRGQLTISKYAKSGYWVTDEIVVTDNIGNQRMEGVHDYGWKLYLDNPKEDVLAPAYVPGSLTIERTDDVIIADGISHNIQRARVRWKAVELNPMAQVYAKLANPAATNVYPMESYGTYDAASSTATVDFVITEYMAPGTYDVPFLFMTDAAANVGRQGFSTSPADQPLVTVPITTSNPDTEAPIVSLNDDAANGLHRILISAHPTNPDHPNGETAVTIKYQARDDKSGLGAVSYRLLDPQGLSHQQYHYHPNFYTQFFHGDPTAWSEYEIDVVLPVGSAPGTWGLQELNVQDKARNMRDYNFVETVQFQVDP